MSPNFYSPALEFKGNLLTLMVLHLFESDSDRIAEQLAEKISKAPGFFLKAPVVIDLHAVQDENSDIDLPELVRLLRNYGLIPVAVRGGNPQQHEMALSMNLGLLTDTKPERARRYLEQEPIAMPVPSTCKILTQPIRSGQQVVALQGDLIVLSTVSHGAEILAHRHLHVYGALRGRALAGVNGDGEARIFCQHLDAELVSVAGQYQVNEDFPENLRGKPAQIYLEEDSLKIEPL
ncbi:MAG: septum site-determining protein MinC [Candidatus Parabeggiatoa sp. nov. 2]|nr:MAG: septum site-determining protein MinC [Beggiatoa sp. 4572_84]RKZ60022.1 MAG: septum site-determining protein MinC [Gammaproteobacteria bacterium]HEC83717.1 septum site-determining protein MinC [Thioploca sp.]